MATRARTIALTTAAILVLPSQVQAQQVYDWTGFYVGVNGGGAWGRSNTTTNVPCGHPVSGAGDYFSCQFVPQQASAVFDAFSGKASGSGFTGGAQAGYNRQNGNFVYGVEADFGAFNLKTSRQVTANYTYNGAWFTPANKYTFTSEADTDWLFTARGRFGWAFSNVLVYATGGLALTNLDTTHSFQDDVAAGAALGRWGAFKIKTGWTVGGGLEWAFAKNWTLKTEYLYVDFGSLTSYGQIRSTAPFGPYADAVNTKVDLTSHIARLGINFKF